MSHGLLDGWVTDRLWMDQRRMDHELGIDEWITDGLQMDHGLVWYYIAYPKPKKV